MTETKLQSFYKRYNKKYFDGKLPAEVPIKLVDMSPTALCGLTTMFSDSGLSLNVIYLDSNLKNHDILLQFTLLHEMCHIKLSSVPSDDPHGQAFDEEMMRLAFRGAFKGIW